MPLQMNGNQDNDQIDGENQDQDGLQNQENEDDGGHQSINIQREEIKQE